MQRQFTTISPTHVKGAKPEAWKHFREGGYVAVGWLEDTDLSNMSDEKIRQTLEAAQLEKPKIPMVELVDFVNHLRVGDLVAVNNINHSFFGIGEVVSGYKFKKGMHDAGGEDTHYSHFRRVRWLMTKAADKKDILLPGEKAWEPRGTVGKIRTTVPEYVWRLLGNRTVDDLSESFPEVVEEGGQFNGLSGQGFQSDSRRRKAVEQYSQQQAIAHYQNQGFKVEVAGKPYDLKCSRKGEVLYVEVKGTETAGDFVFLTKNEVKHAREHPMELFVLSKVVLKVRGSVIKAISGEAHILRPWKADDSRLIPYAFIYQLR
jgi:hypothetical protein